MEFQLKTTSSPTPKKPWTLESILRLTSKYSEMCKNIESWMEKPRSDVLSIEETMLQFQEESGIEDLHDLLPGANLESSDSLGLLMRSLSTYYLAGFLAESLRGQEKSSWWITGFFFKGQWFDLHLSDQIRLPRALPSMNPLQVKTAPAVKMLPEYNLHFLPIDPSTQSFLFRPTHVTSLLLLTESPEPFSRFKIEASHKLINRFFNP